MMSPEEKAKVWADVGRRWTDMLINRGLPGDGALLDIGCGPARMASLLVEHLKAGRYEGFDTSADAIAKCKKAVRARNFNFQFVDIYNARYNAAGAVRAESFRFPYPDSTFDAALAASVFTHMFPRDVAHYLDEIARVLKPGGFCVCSYFLLNKTSEEAIVGGEVAANRRFPHHLEGCRVENEQVPERAVALPELTVMKAHETAGLRVEEILPGTWATPSTSAFFQDRVIALRA